MNRHLIRQGLDALGVERVTRGMMAFDVPKREQNGYVNCFYGYAARCGGDSRQWWSPIPGLRLAETIQRNLGLDSCLFGPIERAFDDERNALRTECIAWLAEHGTAVEPTPLVEAVR